MGVEDSGLFVCVDFVYLSIHFCEEFKVLDWWVGEEFFERITLAGGIVNFESKDGLSPLLKFRHFLS